MSNTLDFGPVYTSAGNIIQLDYATKCAEAGSTIIAMKSTHGLVVAVEKPRESKLVSGVANKRVKKLAPGVYMACTGLMSDAITIFNYVKADVDDFCEDLDEKVSPSYLKALLSKNVSLFTRYYSFRPIGCHIVGALHHHGEYKLLVTDCTSKTSFVRAYAVGKGAMRAKTELEKIDFGALGVMEMAEHAVRIMYKSYDPLKDKEFDIELCYLSDATNFLIEEIAESDLGHLVEKYKDYTVDGE